MTGSGIQDSEYLFALERKAPRTSAAMALLAKARSLATHFPSAWAKGCMVHEHEHAHAHVYEQEKDATVGAGTGWIENWGDDGYAVENASAAVGGSSAYNDLRLAIAAELDL